jgi:beta-glucosidase
MGFPKDFVWGVATSSYQIEGAVAQDGRGATIWDTFSHTPGKTLNGDTGDVACDHYNRYKEDVALMASLAVQSYRFSLAWSRILPQGTGKVNGRGLDFYDRLVDELLSRGIVPMVTLYHWDLPQTLQDAGGWVSREIVNAFVEYVDVATRHLGDRVKLWTTHNEPWCISFLSHFLGEHAPGQRSMRSALAAAHHVMLSHGMALEAIRANVRDVQAGITLNFTHVDPADDREEDITAAHRYDGYFNRWFLDPLFKAQYPEDMWAFFGNLVPPVQEGDLETIARPMDYLGMNYYTRTLIGAGKEEPFFTRTERARAEHTAMDWEVHPQGMEKLLVRIHETYNPPAIYITENGAAFDDAPNAEGEIADARRQAFLEAHFEAAERALAQGVPLKGYYVWSFLDNFEWAFGYERRFGIVYVDFKTQKRTPKQSARWYRDWIEAHKA